MTELELPQSAARKNSEASAENIQRWDYLLGSQRLGRAAYVADTHLLTTAWNQGSPYNLLTPAVGESQTLTGCTQTAVAQVMRFHAHPEVGAGGYEQSWNGTTLVTSMNRPFNWTILTDTISGASPLYVQEEVSALMRDIGILNLANWGTSATSTSLSLWDFARAFGYGTDIGSRNSSAADFYSIITNDIDKGLPVLVSLPGHMVVGDGYASTGAGRNIHLNMGWGGSNDNYYFLDATFTAGNHTFSSNHTVYYNIQPCSGTTCADPTLSQLGRAPQINGVVRDIALSAAHIFRIDAIDPDGDAVTLSASSNRPNLKVSINSNLLTVTPTTSDSLSSVNIQAHANGGSDSVEFSVLSTSEPIAFGNDFSVGGTFASSEDIHSFRVYLDGSVTISGDRGYTNQAFFISVQDNAGTTVVAESDTSVNHLFTPGIYQIQASLSKQGQYYSYNPEFAGFSVTAKGSGGTVIDVAKALGISTKPPVSIPTGAIGASGAINVLLLD